MVKVKLNWAVRGLYSGGTCKIADENGKLGPPQRIPRGGDK